PGKENTDWSRPPGTAPRALRTTSPRARPIVAVGRLPGPNKPVPHRTPSRRRTGPLMTITWDGLLVVAQLVQQLATGSVRARTAATTVGRYSGRHPAITALMAT